jgi:hypothetical protein
MDVRGIEDDELGRDAAGPGEEPQSLVLVEGARRNDR